MLPKIPGSSFSIKLVVLVLRIMIEGAVSMRVASMISGLIYEFFGGHRFDGLSHATVQNYLLRVGLDQLSHVADASCWDRVWIMDHMIAAGSLKCFRTGKTITVGFGLVLRSANGVGSRFRATTNHMENASSENDSRPLPQDTNKRNCGKRACVPGPVCRATTNG
jgi:hypothetical protein